MKKFRLQKKTIIFISALLLTACGPDSARDSDSARVSENADLTHTSEWNDPLEATHDTLSSDTSSFEEQAEPEPEPIPEPEPVELHLLAVGDNLMHMGIVKSGLQEDGSYNFDFEFEDIAPFLDKADIAIINQETPLAGNQLGFSGYPAFNSPTEVGDAIAKAGFNVVLGATNHAYDQKLKGLISFADFFAENHPEVTLCGIHGTLPEADSDSVTEPPDAFEAGRIKLLDVEGYTFAFLNYVYGPNIGSFPRELEGHLDILCAYDPKSRLLDFTTLNPQVIEDIALADKNADVVIVCPHWGTEYTAVPSKYQIAWAMQMTDAGADVIIGAHPHVVQPVEQITTETGHTSLVFYSLGNYVSTQKERRSMLEAMAWITFRDEGDGLRLVWDESGALGMINQYTAGPLRFNHIYLLEDYTDELAATHGIRSWGEGRLNLDDLHSWEQELFGDMKLDRKSVLGD